MNPTKPYIAAAMAGDKPDRHHAARLNANECIQARVVSVYDGDTLTVDAGRLTTKDHIRRKLSDLLIAENLGRPYRGRRRKGWCP